MKQLFLGISAKEQISSHKFFHRGLWEKADEEDIKILKPKQQGLTSIDKLVRKFKFIEALELTIERNNTKEMVSLLEEFYSKDLIDKILYQIK